MDKLRTFLPCGRNLAGATADQIRNEFLKRYIEILDGGFINSPAVDSNCSNRGRIAGIGLIIVSKLKNGFVTRDVLPISGREVVLSTRLQKS